MPLALFAHPFSSYCQKVMIALYENETPFALRLLDHNDPATLAEFASLWPVKRFPLLLDGERAIAEATIIVEHLSLHYPGPVKLLPDDPDKMLEVRFVDRFFDNDVQTPQSKIVRDALRQGHERDTKRGGRCTGQARHGLCLVGATDGRSRMGGGRPLQPRGLLGGACPVLRRLDLPDQRHLPKCARIPQPSERATVLRSRHR
jgi:Glutathione S-transferase, N-terminal domain